MFDPHPIFAPDDPVAVDCYRDAIRALRDAGIDYLIGGAYSFARYTGIARDTKDLDVFLRPRDRDRALAALAAIGFETEVTYSHWLAKARRGENFIDLIHSSGNSIAPVDDGWFVHAVEGEVVGERVRLCPAEESLWSKAFIMERNRYDGADVAHILRACGDRLDWPRLLKRFGPNWPVLYSHVILFAYVYPSERDRVPAWVMRELGVRLAVELAGRPKDERICRGTLLAAVQYLPDVEGWGYDDARQPPHGPLTPDQVRDWTDGVLTGR